MSRETDSPSSGPQGRGGAAYPSGTPPYGTPAQGAAADGGVEGARRRAADEWPEEPETQTTLTTRIRINIPGSRPIPPVVMRTPMGEGDGDGAGRSDGAGAAGEEPGAPGTPGGPSSASRSASSSAPAASGAARSLRAEGAAGSSGSEGAEESEETTATSDWFAPRKSPARPQGPGTPAPGAPGPRGGGSAPGTPGAPGAGQGPSGGSGGTGSFDVSGAVASGPLGSGPGREGDQHRGDLPFFSDGPRPTGDDTGRGATGPAGRPGAAGPAGPTTGPVTGDSSLTPPAPAAPSAPGGGRMSDDTAILTPQKAGPGGPRPPAPKAPGAPGTPAAPGSPATPGGNVSGETLTSGIPVVPPAQGDTSAFAPGAAFDEGGPHTPPKLPEPVQPETPKAAAPSKPKKKGRSKLVLLVAGVVVLACGAYGAGLVMNHADVPKGTTVLGVDIGGGTRDEAVKKLDAALSERVTKPLKLSVGGDQVTLKPDQAGLTLNSQETVRSAAGSDYNPVSVIGSLFGGERVVEPVVPVDEEKLAAALERVAGGSGSAKEGTIKFVPGKAIPVYGKAGKGIDADAATKAVVEAYKKQIETGSAGTVAVPVTNRKPKVPNSEVDRLMRTFAKPAMSGNVIIKAGGRSLPFGPAKSLPKVLEVKANPDGTLSEKYDLVELKKLYGNFFDGVLIERGTGQKTPVQPTDVAQAMGKALRGKTPAERVGVIGTG